MGAEVGRWVGWAALVTFNLRFCLGFRFFRFQRFFRYLCYFLFLSLFKFLLT